MNAASSEARKTTAAAMSSGLPSRGVRWLRSSRYGIVAFGVLNAGVPVPEARARQDAFVRALIDAVGAEPWPYETPTRPAYTLAIVE